MRWPVSSRCGNQIARRARDCGRAPETIKLVAVSKTFSAEEVWPTIASAGQTRFGENRVQEAIPKWRDLRARAATLGKTIELHLIGPLQSNKAREAVETFDVIETVDREKIAAALAREIDRVGKRPRLFVEINTGGEAAEGGRPSRGRRRLYRALPPDLWIDDRGPDGHSPGERAWSRPISPCSASSRNAMD